MSILGYPEGAGGAEVLTDAGRLTGANSQVMKLAESAAGVETSSPADTNGLLVSVSGVQTPMRITAAPATPVAVRLSTGSAFKDTEPVSVSSSMGVSGGLSLTGTIPVSGVITANQGTHATSPDPILLSDGLQSPQLTLVGAHYALNVNKLAEVTARQNDKTSFAEGGGRAAVVSIPVNDAAGAPSEDKAAEMRITPARGVHANIRNSSAIEVGKSTPVTGSNALKHTVRWMIAYGFVGSGVNVPMYTPPPGFTAFIEKLTVTIRAGAGGSLLSLYDQVDTPSTRLYYGRPAVGTFTINFFLPQALSAPSRALLLNCESTSNGDLALSGFYK